NVMLSGLVPCESDSVHHPAVAVIVVDRIVLGTPVVPECQRTYAPLEAAGEFRTGLVAEKGFEQRGTLVFGHVLKPHGVRNVDVQRLATSLGMCPNRWMLGKIFFPRVLAPILVHPVFTGFGCIGLRRAVDGYQTIQHSPQSRG